MEKGLAKLFSSCRSLESLNVSENEILKGDCFEGLPKTIKKLNISWYIFFIFCLCFSNAFLLGDQGLPTYREFIFSVFFLFGS